jgi:catechol 2,3-dioxygenase-like lactoylglutathione lyase family enzyme
VKEPFVTIDHVQLAMPRGEESAARRFYGDVLGMREMEKPEELKKRGGCWFASGAVQIHLGVEDEFRPAKKAHPGLKCADYDGLLGRLRGAGIEVQEDRNIPGVRRCHVQDCFGNRLELIAEE